MKPEPTENVEKQTVEETLPTDEKLVGEPDIPREDSTPRIDEQAASKGFECRYYNFGLLEGDGSQYFNPAIIERPDGYWMLTRRSEPHPQGFRFGQNNVWAFMLDETGKVPKMGQRLRFPTESGDQHFEDPRAFYHHGVNQTCVGSCTFIWYPDRRWTGAHQCFGMFDEQWQCRAIHYPKIGGNPGKMTDITDPKNYEKNWLWWLHENKLHILYKADPWTIFGYGNTWTEIREYRWNSGGVKWPWGVIRGGTNPIKVGDYYFTFHHSSLPWRGKYRRYYAGCLAFDAEPPFRPRLITREPLLIGSQNDEWTQRKPLVVFPCGAVFKNDKWLASLGVNDIRAAWMEIEHEKLLSLMGSVDVSGDQIFQAAALSDNERKMEEQRNGGDAECKSQMVTEDSTSSLRICSDDAAIVRSAAASDEYRPRSQRKVLTKKTRKGKKRVKVVTRANAG